MEEVADELQDRSDSGRRNRSGDRPERLAKVLDAAGKKFGFTARSIQKLLMGGASIDVHGVPLTDETIETAKASDAVLMGSIGGDAKTSPWYQTFTQTKRPEAGLLKIRKATESVRQSSARHICIKN